MAAYRLRPDGIIEIIRPPDAAPRLRKAVSRVGAALSLLLVPASGLALFVSMGLPLAAVAILAVVASLLWLSRRGDAAEPSEPVLRLAHAGQRRSASARSRMT